MQLSISFLTNVKIFNIFLTVLYYSTFKASQAVYGHQYNVSYILYIIDIINLFLIKESLSSLLWSINNILNIYKVDINNLDFIALKERLKYFFSSSILFLLTFQVFSWIQNQPTSDRWKLGIESFSFCKYQFASSVFFFCLASCPMHPAVFHPHQTPVSNEVNNWIGTQRMHN